jgi:hypothetical protein
VPGTNSTPAADLAPLIIQEIKTGAKATVGQVGQFGTLNDSNGPATLDLARPAVYWEVDSVQINGKPHTQFTYQWCYSLKEQPDRRGSLSWQGVRITLDTQGRPAAWEVLADTSGARLIFVSESLEAAAVAEFGKPLAGRRYVVERGVDDVPGAIVPRLVDDGPIAMGPIVYLCAETHNVSTLICRCMPAQVKHLEATHGFDLHRFTSPLQEALLASPAAAPGAATAFWSAHGHGADGLETWLRLPKAF